jgi:hypothetical protein
MLRVVIRRIDVAEDKCYSGGIPRIKKDETWHFPAWR